MRQITNEVSKILRAVRLAKGDPGVAPYPENFRLSFFSGNLLRLRYAFAAKGVPLSKNERNLISFKNSLRGQTAILLGNGPSLNKLDANLLDGLTVFGSNLITTANIPNLKVDHVIVEDTFMAEDNRRHFSSLARSDTNLWFGNYLKYCMPDGRSCIRLNVSMYYNSSANDFPKWSKDAGRIIYTGGTVSYMALQLAAFMGVKRLILFGFDNNYELPILGEEANGNDILSSGPDLNHFSTDYFGKGKRWHDPMVGRMETSYKRAREMLFPSGVLVVNSTPGGRLEIFPRLALAEAIAMSHETQKQLLSKLSKFRGN